MVLKMENTKAMQVVLEYVEFKQNQIKYKIKNIE